MHITNIIVVSMLTQIYWHVIRTIYCLSFHTYNDSIHLIHIGLRISSAVHLRALSNKSDINNCNLATITWYIFSFTTFTQLLYIDIKTHINFYCFIATMRIHLYVYLHTHSDLFDLRSQLVSFCRCLLSEYLIILLRIRHVWHKTSY